LLLQWLPTLLAGPGCLQDQKASRFVVTTCACVQRTQRTAHHSMMMGVELALPSFLLLSHHPIQNACWSGPLVRLSPCGQALLLSQQGTFIYYPLQQPLCCLCK
jgi:hypothetical protein